MRRSDFFAFVRELFIYSPLLLRDSMEDSGVELLLNFHGTCLS